MLRRIIILLVTLVVIFSVYIPWFKAGKHNKVTHKTVMSSIYSASDLKQYLHG
ncbi:MULTISPECIES: hypothetical protein [Cysteiniphilum]|uniref:hypothetical protein n=1 Tax=Cysteiniphilum TaxID=2056696 RepID=UPI00178201B7|nr:MULTISPECIES: hypothetical protein [Cysteiniphilum]